MKKDINKHLSKKATYIIVIVLISIFIVLMCIYLWVLHLNHQQKEILKSYQLEQPQKAEQTEDNMEESASNDITQEDEVTFDVDSTSLTTMPTPPNSSNDVDTTHSSVKKTLPPEYIQYQKSTSGIPANPKHYPKFKPKDWRPYQPIICILSKSPTEILGEVSDEEKFYRFYIPSDDAGFKEFVDSYCKRNISLTEKIKPESLSYFKISYELYKIPLDEYPIDLFPVEGYDLYEFNYKIS